LPLLFYFFCADLDAVVGLLAAAGVEVARTGHPPHALGGEVKVLDPDGNTVLVGQPERSASAAPAAAEDDDATIRFSLLKEAAEVVSAQGGTTVSCQVRTLAETTCPDRAEVKLADTGGDVAWVCLAHAEEILITVPTAFIASQGESGIGAFMSRHR
jgi:hypothetical protein